MTGRSPESQACTQFSNDQAPDKIPNRASFPPASNALWDGIKDFIVETLPAAIAEGPFIGGARLGVDDFHVGIRLARIAIVLGAQKSEGGRDS